MTQSSTRPIWFVEKETARLETATLACEIELHRPSTGLRQLKLNGRAVAHCEPLQVSPEPPAPKGGETLIESYVRGNDLIATYAQTPSRTVQPTYYWQGLEAGPLVGVELMVSMQTSLLASDPTLTALTTCKGKALWISAGEAVALKSNSDEAWQSPAGAEGFCLFRLANGISYAEMVFPADFLGARVTFKDDACQLAYRMFPESLEKGVIRRGRIRGWFLPTDGDVDAAFKAYQQLQAEDPPLTT